MAKLNISSLFVMALLASPSFALFFGAEPRGIEDMDAREFDVMFRREVQAHKDIWVQVDEKLRVIDLPWFPFLARTFLTRYRDFIIKNNKHRGHTTPITTGSVSPSPSAPAGPPSAPAGGNTALVGMPVPSIPAPVLAAPPILPDTNGAQAAVAAREYIEDLITRTYEAFSGSELDARGDSDEHFFAREPQLQYTDELLERGFDDELFERGFDDELFERGFDDDLFERSLDDDLLEARDFSDFEEVNARGYEDEQHYARGYGTEDIDDVFAREYLFDDLD